ncbi:MAG: tetratricopeptide repeat protein, partial [Candidatus Dadabacteria bacterium]|nr:tetratricopeptide repeat protein [Candidatus Dadabacteria bacterium]
ENDNVLQHLGFLEYQRNNPQRAIELMLKAISINPLNPDHYINLGAVYKHFGRFKDAIECYQTALQL